MAQKTLLFHPERILWIGIGLISFSFIAVICFLNLHCSFSSLGKWGKKAKTSSVIGNPLTFSLTIKEQGSFLPPLHLKEELSFSFDPPRPNEKKNVSAQLGIHLKKSGLSRKISLPSRLDLEYQDEKLVFSKEKSPFWLELHQGCSGEIQAKALLSSAERGEVEIGLFSFAIQQHPIQTFQDLEEGSPFRLLAEARSLGRDLFKERLGFNHLSERIEIGFPFEMIELKEGEWLAWKEERWQKISSVKEEKNDPIVRIHSYLGKLLVLEGWGSHRYVKFSTAMPTAIPLKIKGEELLSSIRVRSEKQISCMLEKQCLVLKAGDWVWKGNGRWKVLRKKEEKEAFLSGKLPGDLFIFEQIQTKQNQKVVQGSYFNASRTQNIPIEVIASTNAGKKAAELQGKHR